MLDNFFDPQSVAIIGASKSEKKLGRLLFNHFVVPFYNKLYPVNPNADEIMGIKCYPSIEILPVIPDLAVVALPTKLAIKATEECSKKGIPAIIVITAGFSEIGREDLQKELFQAKGDSRLIGPNCLGVIDMFSRVNTMFPYFEMPNAGNASIVSQSGSLAIDLLLALHKNEIGLRRFVSYGNGADINETDLVGYFGQDSLTNVIGMYLESIKGGREFIKTCQNVTRKKPIVVLKLPVTKEVEMAAKSHTGSLAGVVGIYREIFRKAGVITCDSTNQFVNSIKALHFQPPAWGKKIALVANTGGPAAMALYRMSRYDLELATLSKETVKKAKETILKSKMQTSLIETDGKTFAFCDMTGGATSKAIVDIAEIFLNEEEVSGIIIIPRTDAPVVSKDTPARVALLGKKFPKKPILVYNLPDPIVNPIFENNGIPVFNSAEDAIDGINALVQRGKILKRFLYKSGNLR